MLRLESFVDSKVREKKALLREQVLQDGNVELHDAECARFVVPLVTQGDIVTGVPCLDPSDALGDLEVFAPREQPTANHHNTLFGVVRRHAKLRGTVHMLGKLLATPVRDEATLAARQAQVRRFDAALSQHSSQIEDKFDRLAELEMDVIWLFREHDPEVQNMYDMVFFRSWFLRWLNGSGAALTAHNLYRILVSPAIGVLAPIAYFLMPFLVLRFHWKIPLSFKTYLYLLYKSFLAMDLSALYGTSKTLNWVKYLSLALSFVFYFQSMFNSVEIAKTLTEVSGVIVTKMKRMKAFFRIAESLCEEKLEFDAFFRLPADASSQRPKSNNNSKNSKNDKFTLFENFGEHLKDFKRFDKAQARDVLLRVYALDGVAAAARMRQRDRFGYVEFVPVLTNHDVQLTMRDMWHPVMSCQSQNSTIVTNDVRLDASGRGIILTGPNAGGKSTFLKSVACNALLAQTLTVCAASHCAMTPFGALHTQINVPDVQGSKSLFEAEMSRCKDCIDKIQRLDTDGQQRIPTLVVMDEIFSSTNPVEGIAGAYAVAKNIAECPNALCILSTHYVYLTKLAKKTGQFKNFKVSVDLDCGSESSNIKYTYKVSPGVSKQYIALELLRKKGFDSTILDDAEQVKNRLVASVKPVHETLSASKEAHETPSTSKEVQETPRDQ